ncbi:hypothetical protein [Caballeronia sp. LZ029]|nr:hypothetical protein [Caballeronia sp. LZ029]
MREAHRQNDDILWGI